MTSDNLKIVESNIQAACMRSGRKRDEVTLIAVSKTQPLDLINEVYSNGIRNFGENKVIELVNKADILPKDIKWHLIGHLQRNKVKNIIKRVELIHSVDSYRLAEQINTESEKADCNTDILIQVNVSGENTKFGISPDETEALARKIAELKRIHIKGLMTIAPFTLEPEENRIYFRKLKQLSVDIQGKNIDNIDMRELSMGMTGDYEIAIEEGATFVRVGTGIFGERSYE